MNLDAARKKIEEELFSFVEKMGERNTLRDACGYALTNGGKRLRPLFVLMIADALGFGLDAMPAALGVEFFHTASLIADDLPCMDDDDMRRSRPSLHKACLLYTSDAADERSSVDLGGRRIIKKQKKQVRTD